MPPDFEGVISATVSALLLVQVIVMTADEFVFHRTRGLGRFERVGHVVDTGVYFFAVIIPALFLPTKTALTIFAIIAVISSLVITKDEPVHARECGGKEQWCHAVLFILHGVLLISIGALWYAAPQSVLLKILPVLVFSWGFYQFYYWNIYYVTSTKTGRTAHHQ